MTETQIENLLLAKNFSECVVYITDEGITVAVPAPADGLSTAQVATWRLSLSTNGAKKPTP